MSTGHKCKRRLQDTHVDLMKMKMALHQLNELKEELDGIEETEDEMTSIMEHLDALHEILNNAKKPVSYAVPLARTDNRNQLLYVQKLGFSMVTEHDLKQLGVTKGRLMFSREKVLKLAEAIPADILHDLRTRILDIYDHVNMDVGSTQSATYSRNDSHYSTKQDLV